MNNQKRTIISCMTAMAAGGFTNSQLTLPMFQKAAAVGIVAAGVGAIVLFLLRPRKTT